MKDMTVGLLTVVEFFKKERIGKNTYMYWKCSCQCGNIVIRSASELKRNRSKVLSCGCYKKPAKDLSGIIYSMLKVVSLHYKENSRSYFLCNCECGNQTVVLGESLIRGHTKSCGCLVAKKTKLLLSHAKDRLMKRVISVNGCLEWTGGKDKDGYGTCGMGYGAQRSHRASYIAFKGKIPEGLLVCHHCDNPPCINPEHLFLGTVKDNALDARDKNRLYLGPRTKKR